VSETKVNATVRDKSDRDCCVWEIPWLEVRAAATKGHLDILSLVRIGGLKKRSKLWFGLGFDLINSWAIGFNLELSGLMVMLGLGLTSGMPDSLKWWGRVAVVWNVC